MIQIRIGSSDTGHKISEKLGALVIKHEKNIAKTGIVAQIKGNKGNSTKTIGLRSDIDALPIQIVTGNSVEMKKIVEKIVEKHNLNTYPKTYYNLGCLIVTNNY